MKEERTCAVICEYNPFHFGHRHQLQALREDFGTVVCLLGSELTQRGEVAIADRYVRARAALENGADLVLELPLPWCCASAREFANGGVSLAKAMGVDALAFSAESDGEALRNAADKRAAAEEAIRERIRAEGNLSYPAAAEEVLGRTLREHPNDILAIEYLRAASGVALPCHILRRDPSFASSSAIRREGVPAGSLPDGVEEVLRGDPSFPRKTEDMGKFLLANLRNRRPEGSCYGVTDELYARMIDLAGETDDFAEFVQRCTNKMFTSARVRRAAWSLAFAFPADMPARPVPYALLLGSNGRGREFLRKTAKSREIPVISRPAAPEGEVYRLNLRVQEVLRLYYGGEPTHKRRPVLMD